MPDKIYHNDEISLREIILKLQDYGRTLWRSKAWIIIAMILGGVFFGLLNRMESPVFPAKLTFMINEDDAGSKLGLGSVLGQFGLGGSSTEFNLDKILELSKSRKITQNVLFNEEEMFGKKDYLANHLIDYLDSLGVWGKRSLQKRWFGPAEKLPLKGFTFSHDSLAAFTKLENKALKSLHAHIIGNKEAGLDPMLETEYSETSGIMELKTRTHKAELSARITNNVYEELSEYYIDKTIEKQKFTYDILKQKTDSIAGALSYAQTKLASFKDRSQSIFTRTEGLTEQKLMLEIQKLTIMYSEAEKNLQVADLSLKNKTPYIQLIDEPLLPIPPNKPSIITELIKGLLLGFFLCGLYILARKIIRDSLKS